MNQSAKRVKNRTHQIYLGVKDVASFFASRKEKWRIEKLQGFVVFNSEFRVFILTMFRVDGRKPRHLFHSTSCSVVEVTETVGDYLYSSITGNRCARYTTYKTSPVKWNLFDRCCRFYVSCTWGKPSSESKGVLKQQVHLYSSSTLLIINMNRSL